MFTRPDITYVVQQIWLHMHDPQELHLTAMKHTLCYLWGHPGLWPPATMLCLLRVDGLH
jgi:hypothetical protein